MKTKVNKTILDSNVTVITEEVPGSISCSIGFWVKCGPKNETDKVNGVSHFIEHLLFKGTKKRTALQISRDIENVGGQVNAFTSREYTCFYVKTLNKHWKTGIDILSDMLLNSLFDKKEFEKERQVVLQEIMMVDDTPDELVHDLITEKLMAGRPLARPILGTEKTIKEITHAEVIEYFKANYGGSNMIVSAAGGGIKHKAFTDAISKSLKKVTTDVTTTTAETKEASSKSIVLKRPLEQVHFCIASEVCSVVDKDRYPLYILSTILGGGMSSRLFQEIREKRGLAYSVFSYLNFYKDCGLTSIYCGTGAKDFEKVFDLINKEIKKIRIGNVTTVEIKNAKEQIKGGILMGLDNNESKMTKLARDEIYFGRRKSVATAMKAIDNVKKAHIGDILDKYYDTNNMTFVAIGAVNKPKLPKAFKEFKTLK